MHSKNERNWAIRSIQKGDFLADFLDYINAIHQEEKAIILDELYQVYNGTFFEK